MIKKENRIFLGYILAFSAALLFGLSTPVNKILLSEINPIVLSGWSYLFSGLFLLPALKKVKKEKYLEKKDLGKMTLIILFGSVVGPLFVLFGLAYSTAYQTSLFLNFEVVFTVLIAVIIFREKITYKALVGISIIIVLLFLWSINFEFRGFSSIFSLGVGLIVFGCLCWALDNNITRTLKEKSSVLITIIKSLFGGIISLFLAIILQINIFLTFSQFIVVFIFGVLTFGISILCFITALKYIGTIRAGVILSLSPFISAILSLLIIGETASIADIIVFFLVLVGIMLIIYERAEKIHTHHFFIHSHAISKADHHHENVKILTYNGNRISHVHEKLKHAHKKAHDSMHTNSKENESKLD